VGHSPYVKLEAGAHVQKELIAPMQIGQERKIAAALSLSQNYKLKPSIVLGRAQAVEEHKEHQSSAVTDQFDSQWPWKTGSANRRIVLWTET
jgi:hypothetical protein